MVTLLHKNALKDLDSQTLALPFAWRDGSSAKARNAGVGSNPALGRGAGSFDPDVALDNAILL